MNDERGVGLGLKGYFCFRFGLVDFWFALVSTVYGWNILGKGRFSCIKTNTFYEARVLFFCFYPFNFPIPKKLHIFKPSAKRFVLNIF